MTTRHRACCAGGAGPRKLICGTPGSDPGRSTRRGGRAACPASPLPTELVRGALSSGWLAAS